MALTLLACEPLQEQPEPLPSSPTEDTPLRSVTLKTTGTVCRERQVTLSASFEGTAPGSVVLYQGESELQVLPAPFQYTIDCATYPEGQFSFMLRVRTGNGILDSAPVSVVVDRTEPSVIGWHPTTPFPTKDEPVEIVFSEPIDPRSLDEAPTALRDGSGLPVAHRAILSEDGRVLRLVPSSPLSPPFALHAELVQRNLTDRVGIPLISYPYSNPSGDFTYWPFAPMEPVSGMCGWGWLTLATHSGDSSPEGIFVAFTEQITGTLNQHLVVARWTGSEWERLPQPPREIKDLVSPSYVALEEDDAGQLVLAWVENGLPEKVYVMRFDGTSWQFVGDPLDTSDGMRMRLDPAGNPVVLLSAEATGDAHVVHWDGRKWGELGGPRDGNLSTVFPSNAGIAVDKEKVVVAWRVARGSSWHHDVYVAEYRDGAWTPLGEPFSGPGSSTLGVKQVSVALDAQGNPLVVWGENPSTPGEGGVYISGWKDSAGWSPPELLEPLTSLSDIAQVRILMDSAGEPWVAWQRESGPYFHEIFYRRHRSSGWEPTQFVSAGWLTGFRVNASGSPRVGVLLARNVSMPCGAILQPQ